MNILHDNHWTAARYSQRMTTKEWREVLLDDSSMIVFRGVPCELKAKYLGAGVVEVYKDIPANNPKKLD